MKTQNIYQMGLTEMTVRHFQNTLEENEIFVLQLKTGEKKTFRKLSYDSLEEVSYESIVMEELLEKLLHTKRRIVKKKADVQEIVRGMLETELTESEFLDIQELMDEKTQLETRYATLLEELRKMDIPEDLDDTHRTLAYELLNGLI